MSSSRGVLQVLLLLLGSATGLVVGPNEGDYHEFYLDIIQGEGMGSLASSSDCTAELQALLGERVVYHAQQFFLTQDIDLDGTVELDVDVSHPGTEVDTLLEGDILQVDDQDIFSLGLTSASTASSSYCCSHNHMDCGTDAWCNESVQNCDACNDVWMPEDSCSSIGGIPRWGDCTNNEYACCPGLECVGDSSHYKHCNRAEEENPERRRKLLLEEVQEQHNKVARQQQQQPSEELPVVGDARLLRNPPPQRARLLYYSYWFKKITANGKMRCSYCSFLNYDADHHYRTRQLLRSSSASGRRTTTTRTLHPEFESYMSFHLTKDIKVYLKSNGLDCLGTNVDDIEVYFAQGRATTTR
mmetsp:Transcript_38703/g.57561  ORF Transcript_38703/g.57561 Transcript_38703/m.57561 type:complete len:357 (-) Transcript_38703:234-1304(-)